MIATRHALLPLALLLSVALSACSSRPVPAQWPSAGMGVIDPSAERQPGYLDKAALPDSLALLPAPPAVGSPAFALDEQVNREGRVLLATPRGHQAALDADLSFPNAAGTYACALGVPVTREDTPRLYLLLQRTRTDAGRSVSKAKDHYRRARPFMVNGGPTCAPEDEDGLRKNGSYPSGHTAIGWAWALTLAEVAPDRADAVLARGRAYAESRLVCNVHWQSDVLEGRFMAAGTVARLHEQAQFRDDVAAARQEVARARMRGLKPNRDCAAEADALKLRPASAL